MRQIFISILALAGCLGAASLAGAQERLLLSDTLIGASVTNAQGDKLGSIEQFIVNPQTGRNEFAIIDVGGIFGFREREIAIPWNELRIVDRDTIVAELTKEELQRAPGFDEDQWESSLDREAWKKEVTDYFERSPSNR